MRRGWVLGFACGVAAACSAGAGGELVGDVMEGVGAAMEDAGGAVREAGQELGDTGMAQAQDGGGSSDTPARDAPFFRLVDKDGQRVRAIVVPDCGNDCLDLIPLEASEHECVLVTFADQTYIRTSFNLSTGSTSGCLNVAGAAAGFENYLSNPPYSIEVVY